MRHVGLVTAPGEESPVAVHDHHDQDHADYEDVVLATEQVELTSAGVDIGSATSHLMFSRLVLRRRGLSLSSGFEVVSREVTYRSPVALTPYVDPVTIDATALRAFVDDCYADAGVRPVDVDTGAVIVTGEAARKRNAQAIGELFAEHGGQFVCAVAGPLLEARLAAAGSGALALSRERDGPVLNLDIGGGTTKISLLLAGRVERIMVVNVGARLVAWDADGVLVRVERAGALAAGECGAPRSPGDALAQPDREKIAAWLADRLFDQLDGEASAFPQLFVAGESFVPPPGCAVVASGGVGEYVYGLETAEYGDLGRLLGTAIRHRLDARQVRFRLVDGAQRLRSTVIGASQYTVQVSGNTIYLGDPAVLPLHNLPVSHVYVDDAVPDEDALAEAVARALGGVDGAAEATGLALACHTRLILSYPALSAFARGLARGCAAATPATLAVLLEQDCGGLLGNLLRPLISVPNLLCVDQVAVADLDYVDIGKPVEAVEAVPVVAKSLIFSG
jgi:ethanolamine utilization protein EutA